MLRLASCCDRRQRQLETLARRCAAIGLEARDVHRLVEVADRYRAFGRELLRRCGPIDRELSAAMMSPYVSDRSIDQAFREVMESELPEPTKRRVREAYDELCQHQQARSALRNPPVEREPTPHEPRRLR